MTDTLAMLARQRAAADVKRATIVRLDPRNPSDGARSADRVAGFRVRPGTERAFPSNILPELVTWLRASDGFNDQVVRRCERRNMVGFVLVKVPAQGSEEAAEMAVDFACNSVFVASEGNGQRTVTSSFFDASRPALLSMVRRALPRDTEIARMK